MKEDKLKIHSVKYNFIMNFALTGAQILFPLITFPYISRVLLAEGSGKVSFASSVAYYFMMVASLGIPTYGIRACAKVRDDKEALSKTVHEIFFINLLMTILVLIAYLISVNVVPRFAQDRALFYINGINVFLNMFGMNWVYQALEQYDYITFRSIIFKLISVVMMFILVHTQDDYVIYGAIMVFAAVGGNVFAFLRLRRIIYVKKFDDYDIKGHLKPIMILFAQNVAVSIYVNLDIVMLGLMKTDTDVGYYNAAVRIKTLLTVFVSSLGGVLLPRMTFFVKNNMMDDFKKYMLKSLNFELMMSLPLTVYFIVYAREVILFLAGGGFEGSILPLQLIMGTITPIAITGILGIQVLTSLGKEKYVLYSVLVGAVSDFILNIILIPWCGAAGAALATTIAEILVLIVQLYYTWDLVTEMGRELHILGYAGMCLVALIGSIWFKMLSIPLILVIALSVLAFFGIYALMLYITGDSLIRDVFDGIRKKIIKR